MSRFDFTDCGSYLKVKVNALWTSSTAAFLIDATKNELRGYNLCKVLFDLSLWSEPSNEYIRFLSGQYLAEEFQNTVKCAAFGHADVINKFGENTAVNRGANFRIFDNEQDAVAWLTG